MGAQPSLDGQDLEVPPAGPVWGLYRFPSGRWGLFQAGRLVAGPYGTRAEARKAIWSRREPQQGR